MNMYFFPYVRCEVATTSLGRDGGWPKEGPRRGGKGGEVCYSRLQANTPGRAGKRATPRLDSGARPGSSITANPRRDKSEPPLGAPEGPDEARDGGLEILLCRTYALETADCAGTDSTVWRLARRTRLRVAHYGHSPMPSTCISFAGGLSLLICLNRALTALSTAERSPVIGKFFSVVRHRPIAELHRRARA